MSVKSVGTDQNHDNQHCCNVLADKCASHWVLTKSAHFIFGVSCCLQYTALYDVCWSRWYSELDSGEEIWAGARRVGGREQGGTAWHAATCCSVCKGPFKGNWYSSVKSRPVAWFTAKSVLGAGQLQWLHLVPTPALGMSLRNISYEAFLCSVFLRNLGKTKPLTWRSVSFLLPSQAAPNLTTSRYNLVAIQLGIKTSFTWWIAAFDFHSLKACKSGRLRQMFEMSHADLKQWRAQRSCPTAFPSGPPPPHFLRSGQHHKGQRFVYSPP